MSEQIHKAYSTEKFFQKLSFVLLLFLVILCRIDLYAQDIVLTETVVGKADVSAPGSISLKPGFHAMAGSNFHAFIGPMQGTYSSTEIPTSVASAPSAGSTGNNYIKEITYREPKISETTGTFRHSETIRYFDGLGRPSQTILVGASPAEKDIIQPVLYDSYGREAIKTLPYLDNVKTGNFRPNVTENTVNTYYSSAPTGKESDSRAYTSFVFDNSPLNRIVSQTGPGADWATNNKSVTTHYLTNTETKPGWNVTGDFAYSSFNYPVSSLYVVEVIDEQGNYTREYKDKLGQVVLKEAKLGSEWLRTAYIYDDLGLLRCVVPPEASGPGDVNLCYFYLYDGRKRLIEKRIPGAGSVKMVYDNRDRLRCTQDANQAALTSPEWTFTKYDELNRPVLTGTIAGAGNQSAVKAAVDAAAMNESRNDQQSGSGYTSSSFPAAGGNILSATYYDNYTFISGMSLSSNLNSGTYDAGSYNFSTIIDSDPKGLVTGTMVKVLSASEDASFVPRKTLYSISYYDKYGHILRTVAENHINGNDVISNIYEDVTYQLVQSKQQHFGYENITLEKWFEYDHTGRLLATREKVNDQPEITLNAMTYNDLGEMITKFSHSNQTSGNRSFIQKTDYVYNIRGWLRKINDPALASDNDLFGQTIVYNTSSELGGLNQGTGLYNGNIAGLKWGIKSEIVRGYRFVYDNLNRLLLGNYAEGAELNTNTGYNNESVSLYDKNGNIKALQRSYINGQVDNLTYTYNTKTNQISSITDTGVEDTRIEDLPGNSTYLYDANGNMTKDGSKNLNDITYHSILNLPNKLDFGSNNKIYYHYTASGTKIMKHNYKENAPSLPINYVGNIVYEGTTLSYIITEEGRIIPFGTGSDRKFVYEYNLKDHLGNDRVTFMGTALFGAVDVVQTTSYYPFGLIMNQYNGNTASTYQKNKYLYNGKELQNDAFGASSLNLYDYGARFYDAQIGRWFTPDMLGEINMYESPYCYVGNNPVSRIDPDGRLWKDKKDERKAEQIANRLEKANDRLMNKIERVERNIAKASYRGDIDKVTSLSSQKVDLTNRAEINLETLTTIGKIGGDQNNVFRFGNNSATPGTMKMGRDSDGTYVINTGTNLGNQVHEIIHAGQISRGEVYIIDPSGGARIPSNSSATFGSFEERAYKAEFSAVGSVPSPLNPSSLRDITYEKIKLAWPDTYK